MVIPQRVAQVLRPRGAICPNRLARRAASPPPSSGPRCERSMPSGSSPTSSMRRPAALKSISTGCSATTRDCAFGSHERSLRRDAPRFRQTEPSAHTTRRTPPPDCNPLAEDRWGIPSGATPTSADRPPPRTSITRIAAARRLLPSALSALVAAHEGSQRLVPLWRGRTDPDRCGRQVFEPPFKGANT